MISYVLTKVLIATITIKKHKYGHKQKQSSGGLPVSHVRKLY